MYLSRASRLALFVTLLLSFPISATCQQPVADAPPIGPEQPTASQPLTALNYTPPTPADRWDWIVDGTVGPRSLLVVGPLATIWQTGFNTPSEWGRTWTGVEKRYGEREADVAISNSLEAGLGALWGEDPRYVPSGRRGIWPRARYAIKTAFVAQRRDGHLAPAWGRYAGNVVNNIIENAWLPPSVTTTRQTIFRSALGLAGRLGGNAWDEFWPDVYRRLRKHQ